MEIVKAHFNGIRSVGESTSAVTPSSKAHSSEVATLRDALSSRIDTLKDYQDLIGKEDCKSLMAPLEAALADLDAIITESKE